MATQTDKGQPALALTLALGILTLDIFMPSGVAVGGLYILVPALLTRPDHRKYLVPLALLATAFILAGMLIRTDVGMGWTGYANKALPLLMFWAAVFFLIRYVSPGGDLRRGSAPAGAGEAGGVPDGSGQNMEEKMAECTRQLEEVNKELEGFSYAVSHDLRAPLRSMNGYARILLEDYENQLDSEGQRILKIVINNARKMGMLVDDLLAFSRAGRAKIEKQTFSMEALARDMVNELAEQQARTNMEINISELPVVHGDKTLIRQVMCNLLENAIKYSGTRDAIEIEIGGYREGDMCTIYVKDNGVGFDMTYVGKLFGVFQRLHSEDQFEGTGIGLSLVKRIIDRHDGRVWAESEEGKGATFYFSLPVKT